MTNPGSSPEPAKDGLKAMVVKGVVGTAALVGTTAIPLVVNRMLTPPTPTSSPSPTAVSSPQVSPSASPTAGAPAANSTQIQSADVNSAGMLSDDSHGKKKGKSKDKK